MACVLVFSVVVAVAGSLMHDVDDVAIVVGCVAIVAVAADDVDVTWRQNVVNDARMYYLRIVVDVVV